MPLFFFAQVAGELSDGDAVEDTSAQIGSLQPSVLPHPSAEALKS